MAEWNHKVSSLVTQLLVENALDDGNPDPLADHLRNGGEIDARLRQHLTAMLDENGNTTFKFVLRGRKPGELGGTMSILQNELKSEIGTYMERRVREYGPGGYEAALQKTKEEFDVAKTTVENAHKYVKNALKLDPNPGSWQYLNDRYPDP